MDSVGTCCEGDIKAVVDQQRSPKPLANRFEGECKLVELARFEVLFTQLNGDSPWRFEFRCTFQGCFNGGRQSPGACCEFPIRYEVDAKPWGHLRLWHLASE